MSIYVYSQSTDSPTCYIQQYGQHGYTSSSGVHTCPFEDHPVTRQFTWSSLSPILSWFSLLKTWPPLVPIPSSFSSRDKNPMYLVLSPLWTYKPDGLKIGTPTPLPVHPVRPFRVSKRSSCPHIIPVFMYFEAYRLHNLYTYILCFAFLPDCRRSAFLTVGISPRFFTCRSLSVRAFSVILCDCGNPVLYQYQRHSSRTYIQQ